MNDQAAGNSQVLRIPAHTFNPGDTVQVFLNGESLICLLSLDFSTW